MCTFLVELQMWALLYFTYSCALRSLRSFSITFLSTRSFCSFIPSFFVLAITRKKASGLCKGTNRRISMKQEFARLASGLHRYAQVCASRRHRVTAHGEGIFLHSYVGKRAMRPTVTLNLRIRIDNNQGCFYLSRYEATYFVPWCTKFISLRIVQASKFCIETPLWLEILTDTRSVTVHLCD